MVRGAVFNRTHYELTGLERPSNENCSWETDVTIGRRVAPQQEGSLGTTAEPLCAFSPDDRSQPKSEAHRGRPSSQLPGPEHSKVENGSGCPVESTLAG